MTEWEQQYSDQLALYFNDLSIHEAAFQYKVSKASYITMCLTQSEVYNFLCLPRGTSESLFKVESLAHLKVGVQCKQIVTDKFSLKHKVK